jgi:ketosteroid isomerase-like protein
MRDFTIMNISKAVDEWIKFWNNYDLHQVNKLFLDDNRVSYFSSEKQGIIKGIDNLIQHHKEFGFKPGGGVTGNKLWLEKIMIEEYGDSAIVTAEWRFQRYQSEIIQRGPVTMHYHKKNTWKITHAHFSNY